MSTPSRRDSGSNMLYDRLTSPSSSASPGDTPPGVSSHTTPPHHGMEGMAESLRPDSDFMTRKRSKSLHSYTPRESTPRMLLEVPSDEAPDDSLADTPTISNTKPRQEHKSASLDDTDRADTTGTSFQAPPSPLEDMINKGKWADLRLLLRINKGPSEPKIPSRNSNDDNADRTGSSLGTFLSTRSMQKPSSRRIGLEREPSMAGGIGGASFGSMKPLSRRLVVSEGDIGSIAGGFSASSTRSFYRRGGFDVDTGSVSGGQSVSSMVSNSSYAQLLQLLNPQAPVPGHVSPSEERTSRRNSAKLEPLAKLDCLVSLDDVGDATGATTPLHSLLSWRSGETSPNNDPNDEAEQRRQTRRRQKQRSTRPPHDVILGLLNFEPAVASIKDKNGRLPLHIAVSLGHRIAVIKKLIELYPVGALVREHLENKTPFDYALDVATSVNLGSDERDREKNERRREMIRDRWGVVKLLLHHKPEVMDSYNSFKSIKRKHPPPPLLFRALMATAPHDTVHLLIKMSNFASESEANYKYLSTSIFLAIARRYPLSLLRELVSKCPNGVKCARDGNGMGFVATQTMIWCYEPIGTGEWKIRQEYHDVLADLVENPDKRVILMNEHLCEWWEKIKFWIKCCAPSRLNFDDSVEQRGKIEDECYMLHYALENSDTPPEIVKILVALYPDSVSIPHPVTGAYPLHIAAFTSSFLPRRYEMPPCDNPAKLLCKKYPDALRIKFMEKLPLHHAMDTGKTGSLRILYKQEPRALKVRDKVSNLYPFQTMGVHYDMSQEDKIRLLHIVRNTHSRQEWSTLSDDEMRAKVANVITEYQLDRLQSVYGMLRTSPSLIESGIQNPKCVLGEFRDETGMGILAAQFISWCYEEHDGEWSSVPERIKYIRNACERGSLVGAPYRMERLWGKIRSWIWNFVSNDISTQMTSSTNDSDDFILHAAASISDTPPPLLCLILAMYPQSASLRLPQSGQYPLHIHTATLPYTARIFETDYHAITLRRLLNAHPDAASTMVNGQLPLHIAISHGRTWEELLPLVMHAKSALRVKATDTKLYPFQLMAVERKYTKEVNAMFKHRGRNKFSTKDWSALPLLLKASAYRQEKEKHERDVLGSIFQLLRLDPVLVYSDIEAESQHQNVEKVVFARSMGRQIQNASVLMSPQKPTNLPESSPESSPEFNNSGNCRNEELSNSMISESEIMRIRKDIRRRSSHMESVAVRLGFGTIQEDSYMGESEQRLQGLPEVEIDGHNCFELNEIYGLGLENYDADSDGEDDVSITDGVHESFDQNDMFGLTSEDWISRPSQVVDDGMISSKKSSFRPHRRSSIKSIAESEASGRDEYHRPNRAGRRSSMKSTHSTRSITESEVSSRHGHLLLRRGSLTVSVASSGRLGRSVTSVKSVGESIASSRRSCQSMQSEREDQDEYKPGGYHKVKEGDIFNERYTIVKKLGWGYFSTVWMVRDGTVESMKGSAQNPSSPPFRALKIQKSDPNYTEAAIDEIELLKDVSKQKYLCENSSADVDRSGIPMETTIEHSKHVAALHDAFMHSGPNGEHACLVFSILNCNLLSIIKAHNFEGIPIPKVKHIMRGLCMGLDFLHRRCQIIHTDIKPENVMLDFPSESNSPMIKHLSNQSFLSSPTNDSRSGRSSLESNSMSPSSMPVLESISGDSPSNSKSDLKDTELLESSRVVLVDLGSACWIDEHFSDDIQTRQYRSPEVLIGAPYDASSDMWSLGCMAFELLTGHYLFDPQDGDEDERDEDHLDMCQRLLGAIPADVIARGVWPKKYFEDQDDFPDTPNSELSLLFSQKFGFTGKEADEASAFILPMLDFNTQSRVTALDCLANAWLNDIE